MSEVTEFVRRLDAVLVNKYQSSTNEYMHVDSLRQCIHQAIDPQDAASDDFPRWLYREDQSRIVNSASEEADAVNEGWSRTAPPRFEAGFPKYLIERPTSQGGTKAWDWRGVWLYSSAEEREFEAAVEIAGWMPDPEHQWGARNIPLSVLVTERKELMKSMIDNEVLEPPVSLTVAQEDAEGAGDPPDLADVGTPPAEESEADASQETETK